MNLQSPFLIPLFLVAVWLLVCLVISWAAGWSDLARTYRATEPFPGTIWRFQSGQMRWMVNYNRPLTVGANPEGLFLSIFPLFRAGHPPLFIPWQDISVRPAKYLWYRIYEFHFRQSPTVRLRVRENLGKKIEAAAGSSWPENRSEAGAPF